MSGLSNIVNEILKVYEIRWDILHEISGHIGLNLVSHQNSYEEIQNYIGDEISKQRNKMREVEMLIKQMSHKSANLHHIDTIYPKIRTLILDSE